MIRTLANWRKGRPLPAGTVIGRWEVVRRAASVERPWWSGSIARQLCRCVCGIEQMVLDRDLKLGRSTGCRHRTCREAWAVVETLVPDIGIERARELAATLLRYEVPAVRWRKRIAELGAVATPAKTAPRLPPPEQLRFPEME